MVAAYAPERQTIRQRIDAAARFRAAARAGAADDTPAPRPEYQPYGAAAWLFGTTAPEVMLAGPAGTGKTRANLERWHALARAYPGARGLVLRKTMTSLTSTALVTFRRFVLDPSDGVEFRPARQDKPAQYEYPNGSVLVLGSLHTEDAVKKVMSGDYDWIGVVEATDILEAEWELLTTRLRSGVLPFQQIAGDCNPGPPTHWIKQRAQAGTLQMRDSHHEDNPTLWDRAQGAWTAAGAAYLATLGRLSGVNRDRLLRGLWVAAEGMIYTEYDPELHLVNPFPIPESWPRYWSLDFGFVNPLVVACWAQDADGRLYRYRELYATQTLVEDAVAEILQEVAPSDDPDIDPRRRHWIEPKPRKILCDHDAGERATFSRKIGLPTYPAYKAIGPGIQAVAARFKLGGDGQPRIFFLRDALIRRDEALKAASKPTCTEEEIEGYVWDVRGGRRKGEAPIDENDHGMDAMRYLVADRDLRSTDPGAPVVPQHAQRAYGRAPAGNRQFGRGG